MRFHPPLPPADDPAVFEALAQALFTRRRKTLANALMAYRGARPETPREILAEAGLDGRRRPETLEIAELVRLSDVVANREKR
jgi:16S rRNA (adenine1518-N6/adenine1519-N6)-dimethyltransferase